MEIILNSGVEITVPKKLEPKITDILLGVQPDEITGVETKQKRKPKRRKVLGNVRWTLEQDQILLNCDTLPTEDKMNMARSWGRTPQAVGQRHWKLVRKPQLTQQ